MPYGETLMRYTQAMDIDLPKIIDAAKAGGDVLQKYFGQVLTTETKSTAADLKTRADVESEQAILSKLHDAFPDWNVYAEESGKFDRNSAYTFVVDPLDGTSNFVMGVPAFCVSIGLMEHDTVVAGVIYNPILDQLYSAEIGKGAYLNGSAIRTNAIDKPSQATVSYTCGYQTEVAYSQRVVTRLRTVGFKRIIDF